MFTECPECSVGFRVTAKVLAQAGGRVRCGGCGNAFSALEHLTEELPAKNEQEGTSSSEEDKFRETSRQLLKTLDDLAGPEGVVIEDTGVEWRVLDDEEEDGEDDAEDAVEAEISEGSEELLTLEDDQDIAAGAAPADTAGEVEEGKADLALDEAEEWTDLLIEDDDGATADDMPLEVEEELAAIHNELSAKEDSAPVDLDAQFEMQAEAMGIEITGSQEIADAEEDDPNSAGPLDEDADEVEDEGFATYVHPLQKAAPAAAPTEQEEMSAEDALTAAQDQEFDEMIHLSLADSAGDAGTEPEPAAEPEHSAGDNLPEQSEEEMTINQQIDQELLAAAAQNQDLKATIIGLEDPGDLFDENSADVETIIMEGDVVRGAMEREREKEKRAQALARFDNAGNLNDTYAANRAVRGGSRSTDPVGYGMITGSTLLVLLLLVQVVHAYREELSIYDLFNQTFGPIYRMLGNPVTPEWDIKGWQFEATNGSVAEGEDVLTIFSRIGNRSEQPLPYPLVHVSLTDRWEEIIGSRVLEPNEYLAGDLDPSRPVVPGDNFTAVITVEEPSVDATGFKVNVCYRVSPGRVRCATEDFKN
jgi:predicted Zn finger-like uncharacterized protein